MKFFVDLSKKQLIKSAASNVALERIVLKRRDSLAVEVVFVSRNAVATMPAGTTVSVALKKSFADSNFLASASGTPPILNLNTVPLEALFSATNPSAVTALLEIRWTIPGETTRTATLQAEVQNSVILGTEATPEAIPDGKATQAEAQAGTNNEKWMTPLRTAQAIAVLAPPPTWDSVLDKPEDFAPEAHTHTGNQIFTTAAYSPDIPPVGGEVIFYPVASAPTAGERLVYRTASGQYYLWFNEENEAWTISEGPLYILPENTRVTADEGDSPLLPWLAAWPHDLQPLSLAGFTHVALNTWATKSEVNSDRITFQAALDGKAPAWGNNSQVAASAAGIYDLANDEVALSILDSEVQWGPNVTPHLPANFRAAIDAQKAGSYATLVSGKVPADQLPSYVDDVLEFANFASLPQSGEQGKIYVTLDTRKAYRWTGSQYLEISPSEVTSVAGKTGAVTLALEDLTNFGSLSARAYKPTIYSHEITANSADSIVAATQLRSQHLVITFRAARAIDFFLPNAISVPGFSWSPQLGDLCTAEILNTGEFTGQWTARFKSGSTTIHTVTRADSDLEKSSLRFVYSGTSWVLDRTVYHQHAYSDLLNTPPDVATGYFDRSGDAASRPPEQGQAPYQVVLANDSRLTNARRTAWVTHPSSPTNIASGLEPGAMAYDGSFLYLLVRMPGGQTMRWARIAMSTTW